MTDHDPGRATTTARDWWWLPIAALVLLAYANSVAGGFVLDSLQLVVRDPRVQSLTREHLAAIFTHTYWWPLGESGLYRPVTTLSFLINGAVAGHQSPAAYHVVNLALHLLNSWLAVRLLQRLLGRRMALVAVALWAVHPLLTEAVSSIAGRADLLASTCTLAALLAYARSRDDSGVHQWAWTLAMAAAILLGIFAKESAVAVIAVIALAEGAAWLPGLRRPSSEAGAAGAAAAARRPQTRPAAARRSRPGTAAAPRTSWWRQAAVRMTALVVPALVLWAARTMVVGGAAVAEFPYTDNPLVGEPWVSARGTATWIGLRYLRLLIWPAPLSADYSYPAVMPLSPAAAAALLVIVAIALAATTALLVRRRREALRCLAVAIILWLPASNLLFSSGTIMAERSMYLPSLGVIAALVLMGRGAASRLPPRVMAAAITAILAAFAIGTHLRNRDWRDDVALWTAAVRTTTHSAKAHRALADAIYAADAGGTQLNLIVDHAEAATVLLAPLPDARNDYQSFRQAGAFRIDRGNRAPRGRDVAASGAAADFERALTHLARALSIARVQGASYGATALARFEADLARLEAAALLGLSRGSEAVAAATRSTRADPANAIGYRLLADAHLASGMPDAAAVTLMVGGLVTGGAAFTRDLAQLYRAGLDVDGCAVTGTADRLALNPGCAIVARHTCAAAAAVSAEPAAASPQLRSTLAAIAAQFRCPATP